jgi:hypothetical protein
MPVVSRMLLISLARSYFQLRFELRLALLIENCLGLGLGASPSSRVHRGKPTTKILFHLLLLWQEHHVRVRLFKLLLALDSLVRVSCPVEVLSHMCFAIKS